MNQSAARRGARVVLGITGLAIGYVIWNAIYGAFRDQVGDATLEAVRSSEAFATICGLAAVLLTLGCGLALAWGADLLAARLNPVLRESTDRLDPAPPSMTRP